jgi:hypothetical protein
MSRSDLDKAIPVHRRLVRSAWSVATGLVILAMLITLAFVVAATAPLWLWAVPESTEATSTRLP